MNAAEEYARRLLKLHRMHLTHKDDSTDAEIIRDEMDALWPRISDIDAIELREYAAELNQFSDVVNNHEDHERPEEVTLAERILKILQASAEPLSSDEIRNKISHIPVRDDEFHATIAKFRSAIEQLSNLHST